MKSELLWRADDIIYDERDYYDNIENEHIPDVFVRSGYVVFVMIQNRAVSGDFHNRYVVYACAKTDLVGVLHRVTRQTSHYINKYEKCGEVVVDRMQCCLDALRWECKYQWAKLRLLQTQWRIRGQTIDAIELYSQATEMLDLMSGVPMLDAKSYYFVESYALHIGTMQREREVLVRAFEMQCHEEEKYNQRVVINLDVEEEVTQ